MDRRFKRVYPLYFTGVILAGVVYAKLGVMLTEPHGGSYEAPTLVQFISSFVFLQNFYSSPAYGMWANAPLWSLCVECFFYALCPLFQKLNTKWLTGAVVASIVVYLAKNRLDIPLVALWAWPFLLGFLYYRVSSTRWANALLAIGTPLILMLPPGEGANGAWLYLVCIYTIMLGNIPGRLTSWLAKPMLWLGEISFPLYICATPLYWMMACVWHVQRDWIFSVGAFTLSVAIYYLIDLPSRWYFKHRSKSRSIKTIPIYQDNIEPATAALRN